MPTTTMLERLYLTATAASNSFRRCPCELIFAYFFSKSRGHPIHCHHLQQTGRQSIQWTLRMQLQLPRALQGKKFVSLPRNPPHLSLSTSFLFSHLSLSGISLYYQIFDRLKEQASGNEEAALELSSNVAVWGAASGFNSGTYFVYCCFFCLLVLLPPSPVVRHL